MLRTSTEYTEAGTLFGAPVDPTGAAPYATAPYAIRDPSGDQATDVTSPVVFLRTVRTPVAASIRINWSPSTTASCEPVGAHIQLPSAIAGISRQPVVN